MRAISIPRNFKVHKTPVGRRYGSKLTTYSLSAGGSGSLLAITAGFMPIAWYMTILVICLRVRGREQSSLITLHRVLLLGFIPV